MSLIWIMKIWEFFDRSVKPSLEVFEGSFGDRERFYWNLSERHSKLSFLWISVIRKYHMLPFTFNFNCEISTSKKNCKRNLFKTYIMWDFLFSHLKMEFFSYFYLEHYLFLSHNFHQQFIKFIFPGFSFICLLQVVK